MSRDRVNRRRFLEAAGTALAAGVVVSPSSRVAAQDDGPYADVYRALIDSVVLIQVLDSPDGSGSTGSGFVYDDEHVLTNDHVVADAEAVDLQFTDERWRSGTVVGTDPYSDLAVVRVEELGADPLSVSEAEPVVGREVVALGNPLGLDASISQGIVSGVDRSLPSPTGFSIPAAIQTDAPVNPGNSGGPLATLEGDVIGVVFAGGGRNIGFAIPAALVRRVVPALIDDGEYEHPYLGVATAPFTPLIAEFYDTDHTGGVLIIDVVDGSPADGILEAVDDVAVVDGGFVPVGADVLVAIDGQEIPSQDRLSAYLALETTPGETIAVEIVRDGESETVDLTLEARPAP
ncbi:S1C family serine protease [Natrononativus amylolyticus]|uniref:S1C family serine protease n=1 Tax=Natrononativus amylolyticus TaxID=2963434 RepID=UPI0020CF18B8|nr:trypsin-like peptidase domain-containing protein [Natrononativus amylolyticus]